MANIINLQVGERHFTASQETLEQSPFLKQLLSSNKASQRVWFVDQDGDTFAHILRYLRTSVYPILYTKAGGYDYPAYALIYVQARFLGLDHLADWIDDQKYQHTINISFEHRVTDVSDEVTPSFQCFAAVDNISDVTYHTLLGTEESYVCPRNIAVHMGDPSRCGRQCENQQPDDGPVYASELVQKTAVTKIRTKLNLANCIDKLKAKI